MNIALFGCGPHAKRIYIGYMVRHGMQPTLIVDIEPAREQLEAIIEQNGWKDTRLFLITPSDPYTAFSEEEERQMRSLIHTLAINKAIVSTPPEVHIPYATMCLEEGLKVLIDKPL